MSRRATNKAEKAAARPVRPVALKGQWPSIYISVVLVGIVWAAFGETLHHGFVNFDDDAYVYENPQVTRGLTLNGITWAFSRFHSFNWHPLTWISHMLDCQFFGLNPGGHHFTNVLLHAAATILLFFVLQRMTGFLWRSAFVAAVFAIHPLRVESVAWVAERKDVLSGVFFMLTVGAYVHYTRRPELLVRYGLVVLLFALGLMSKPMLVTLPAVLLLLDYWPLNRFQINATKTTLRLAGGRVPTRLFLEKLPLLGLAVASSAVTLFAQSEAIRPLDQIPFSLRADSALISYVAYLGQMFWPSRLAVLYPFPVNGSPFWQLMLVLVILTAITAIVFLLRNKRPYLLSGWLWYLIMLAPVIGIFQVGTQARADRYTYLPQIGLYVSLTWLMADLCACWRSGRWVLGGCSSIIVLSLMLCSRTQTSYWRNSESLWVHTLSCTRDNFIAHNNLGVALLEKGSVNEAIDRYEQALKIRSNYADAHSNLGSALLQKGNVDEAMAECRKALQLNPKDTRAHNNIANALLRKGNVDEAISHCQTALDIAPDNAEAHNNLGYALLQRGNIDEAIAHFQKTLQLKPNASAARLNLENALHKKGVGGSGKDRGAIKN